LAIGLGQEQLSKLIRIRRITLKGGY